MRNAPGIYVQILERWVVFLDFDRISFIVESYYIYSRNVEIRLNAITVAALDFLDAHRGANKPLRISGEWNKRPPEWRGRLY